MDINALRLIIGESVDAQLLEEALTHRSFAEGAGGIPNLERLEFLGDSVLGFVVTEDIFARFPELNETKLTQVRIKLVSEPNLAVACRRAGINAHIRLGKGVIRQGDQDRPSILADVFEAVIGAIFVDKGLDAARRFVHAQILDHLEDVDDILHQFDPRADLEEFCRKRKLNFVYEYSAEGPANQQVFTARVLINKAPMGVGTGATRKAAATAAAAATLVLSGVAPRQPKQEK